MNSREIMGAATVAALASNLALASACSSSSTNDGSTIDASITDSGASSDTGNPGYFVDTGVNPFTYTSFRLENDSCFPNALTLDGGLVDCHVVLFFPGASSCASLGLTNASTDDATYLDAYSAANGVPLPTGSFCALDQLPSDACLADASAGWCYVPGGCEPDAGCAQSVCPSSGFTREAGTGSWLVCPRE